MQLECPISERSQEEGPKKPTESLTFLYCAKKTPTLANSSPTLSFRRSLAVQPNVRVPLKTLVKRFMGRDIEENGDIPVSCVSPQRATQRA